MRIRLVDLSGQRKPLKTKSVKFALKEYEHSFLWGLIVPGFLITFLFRVVRVEKFSNLEGFFSVFDLFKSDFFFWGAFGFIGLVILRNLSLKRAQITALITLQVLATLFIFVENSAHNFYLKMNHVLEFHMLAWTLNRLHELRPIMATEASFSTQAIMGTTILLMVALPWFVRPAYRWYQNRMMQHYGRVISYHFAEKKINYVLAALIFMFTAGLFLPSMSKRDTKFPHNSIYVLAKTYFTEIEATKSTAALWEPPTDTSLQAKPYAKKRNLVFIVLESTRLFSSTLHDKSLNTHMFLNQLAQKSLLAEYAYSVIPRTSKSIIAIHCGIEPRPTMITKEAKPGNIPAKCLPRLLREQGYATAYFQTANEFFENRRGLVNNFGFEEFFPGNVHNTKGFELTNYHGYEDRVLLGPSLSWHKALKRYEPKRPFMVTYLTNTSHHIYGLPRKFAKQQYNVDHIKSNYATNFKGIRSRGLYNRYLNTIRYVDMFLKELIDQYKREGLYKNTVFVIAADHGEGFWEHGFFSHSNTIYDEGLRIPFLIHDPLRFKNGMKVNQPVNHLDILPTAVDLVGFEIYNGIYRGNNILRLQGKRTLRSACWQERLCATQYMGHLKYIHHFNNRPDEVYNLKSDPYEKNNIISQFSEVQKWKQELTQWYQAIENVHQRHEDTPFQYADSVEESVQGSRLH